MCGGVRGPSTPVTAQALDHTRVLLRKAHFAYEEGSLSHALRTLDAA
ncbi:hypothetical protein GCM10022416_62460 [Actinomadura keratinilytica]|uniref:Uncharacterized protein n=1 Tax=Actinomadura keratinilytica TaxID=547461 RepID=A0ABP6UKJ3_9ACTN